MDTIEPQVTQEQAVVVKSVEGMVEGRRGQEAAGVNGLPAEGSRAEGLWGLEGQPVAPEGGSGGLEGGSGKLEGRPSSPGLDGATPPPPGPPPPASAPAHTTRSHTRQNVVIHPRLKPVAFALVQAPRAPLKQPVATPAADAAGRAFYNLEDHPLNKRGYKYKPCAPSGALAANLYSTTEIAPYKVCPSLFDRASGIVFDDSMSCVLTLDGWRLVRTNVGVREGSYFCEFVIVNANNAGDRSHVRIGFGRREAALEAPVGFDGYGYGLRDVNGQRVTLSRPRDFGSAFLSGDVIGMKIELPPLRQHREHVARFVEHQRARAPAAEARKKRPKRASAAREPEVAPEVFSRFGNVWRDQIPIKYKNLLYYEQYEYTATKRMDHQLNPVTVFGERAVMASTAESELATIPGSRIVVYKNGVEMGTMFEELYSFLPASWDDEANTRQALNPGYKDTDDGQLGYYPMISVYRNAVVEFNAGPQFRFAPPAGAAALSDRFDEEVVTEWLWDLVDEVEAAYLDEGLAG